MSAMLKAGQPIAVVEQETGVPKDLLRQWERRYGFPAPSRDEAGDRRYSADEIRKLKVIKRLIERGRRPSTLIHLSLEGLQALEREQLQVDLQQMSLFIPMLQAHDAQGLRDWLQLRLNTQGLRRFVLETVVEANQAVGMAWAQGLLAVHEEHFYTQQVQNLLRIAVTPLLHANPPRVLLCTLPAEPHGLGLLMVECLLALKGCQTLPYGVEMPLEEVAAAVCHRRADVLALSFSLSFTPDAVLPQIQALRPLLPTETEIWLGGQGVLPGQAWPESVWHLPRLVDVETQVDIWRAHGVR